MGPAASAPMRPPRVKNDETRPNCAGVIGMHCGRPVDPAVVVLVVKVEYMRASAPPDAVVLAHVMTCCGAFSSAR